MNEATKEIQVARSVSGSVLGHRSIGDPLSAGVYSGGSATIVDLPSDLSIRKHPRPARRHERRSKPVADLRPEGDGRGTPPTREPRWHKVVRRYPNTVGLACVTLPIAVIAQIAVSLH
jgi:hypothetical protein